MPSRVSYRGVVWFVLLFLPCAIRAQMESKGFPVGDYRQMNAEEVIYLLPPPDPIRVEAELLAGQGPHLKSRSYAFERPVSLSPYHHGAWSEAEAYRVWRIHLISPGATSVGLFFSDFILEPGVRLLLYDPGMKDIRGAFTSLNNKRSGSLAVRPLPGEEVIVELQVPRGKRDYGALTIGSLYHGYRTFGSNEMYDGRFGLSQACEIDINCPEGSGWQLEKTSVVRVNTLTQYCTGVLVNNSSYNGDPLLLTASHCIDQQSIAEKTVFAFGYESPSCFGEDAPIGFSISGSEMLAVGDSLDFCLVRLSSTPQDSVSVYYAGWTLSDDPPANTATIHHPEGDVKKISFDEDAPVPTDSKGQIPSQFWNYRVDSFWWIKQWDTGSTERGSSGCPLFSPERKVMGVLSFGSAFCGDSIGYDEEAGRVIFSKTVNRDDYYTRMGSIWDHHSDPAHQLRYWLDPENSDPAELEGYKPLVNSSPDRSGLLPDLELYPNPVKDRLYLRGGTSAWENATYLVIDLSGRVRISGKLDGPAPYSVSCSGLPPGLYALIIKGGGRMQLGKFIMGP